MNSWIYRVQRLVTSPQTGKWCGLRYPNHKHGCPKYGNDAKCPPQAPQVRDVFDIQKPLYLVHSEFDFAAHVLRMRAKFPAWSDLQCRCVLYWQSRSRKQLGERILMAHHRLGTSIDTTCPEGMGVNVYATARLSGLKLERIRSLSTCRHVALLGWKEG